MGLLRIRRHSVIVVSLFLLLSFILAACDMGGGNGTPAANNNKQASKDKGQATATSVPAGIKLGAQPCPAPVSQPQHWDAVVPTQANINKVDSVICGNLEGTSSLQALVLVRAQNPGSTLDVYVYSNITTPGPKKDFQLLGLYKGDARLSKYNTVITGEVDQDSTVNKGKVGDATQIDLHREFKWSDSATTLVPVTFPGIFPVLTRYEAEAEQIKVNDGQNFWERDAGQTANHLATQLLKWSDASSTMVNSGGGQNDTNAEVSVKSTGAGNNMIKVSMSRLEGNTNGGIWVVTAVTTDGMSIDAPQALDRLNGPVAVSGKGNAFEGVVGSVKVLNHLYEEIGTVQAKGAAGNGATSYTASVTYNKTFKTGNEEGLVTLYMTSNADGAIAGAVMVKEMLS